MEGGRDRSREGGRGEGDGGHDLTSFHVAFSAAFGEKLQVLRVREKIRKADGNKGVGGWVEEGRCHERPSYQLAAGDV